ncbi:MAG: ATP-dependent DNA helicase [Gammaproteobacteria bacterium]|nr:ATP-dependent DNA helicase [Gammaproteobacteria bacterium]
MTDLQDIARINNMSDITELLSETGPLADSVSGFAPRAEQQQMAEATAAVMADGGKLIVEAGTGTGKTFAYLMPALRSGMKVIISTGTRHLQDQLYGKDLPVVRDALNLPVHIALLKGRSNYLCRHRLETVASDGRRLSGRQLHELEEVRAWEGRTKYGDIAELGLLSEDSPVWPRVTSTTENCLGQECEHFQDCFVIKARRNALEADVVVINHHLLFADMALREEGFGELLPGADAFIIDEAHQLPEVASVFFGTTLSSHQLRDLARDVRAEHLREAGDMQDLPDATERLDGMVHRLRLALGQQDRRAAWSEVAGNEVLQAILEELAAALMQLKDWLTIAAERGKGLESCRQRAALLQDRLSQLMEHGSGETIHWFETMHSAFRLNLTPLNVAPVFRKHLDTLNSAWVFTSATLAVGNSFEHFAAQLGLEDAQALQLDSPFDYQRNALLYLPDDMPDPNAAHYVDAVVSCAREVLEASAGRAFLLFTSHSALRRAATLLENDFNYPLLVQGSAPRQELLEQFRRLGNAVLLGTSSFWEGVDVRGEALSCVIIDKLPFSSPGDPVLQARIEALRKQGVNPFMAYQLPNAVITLKQGIGRLIRDHSDRGVLVLCDPRLRSKGYGRVFLNSLPDMPRTHAVDSVHEFFIGLDSTRVEPLLSSP